MEDIMINLVEYGFIPTTMTENIIGIPARITAVHKERYELICEFRQIYGRLKASVYYVNQNETFPITGDFVMIQYNNNGDSQILKTLQRKSVFTRNNTSRLKEGYTNAINEQDVAANFDYVFILISLNFDFNLNRIERYLTLAWQSGAIPVILLTKADLIEDYSEKLRTVEKVAIGVGVYAVSSKTGLGLNELGEYLLPGKTIVFLGSSGVGKSSLVNALAKQAGHKEVIMVVNDIREKDSKGRHTTTHRQLIMLNSGVMIIDTPGMRELGMLDVSMGLGQSFSDVEQYMGKCRFNNCQHQSEPGCAIKEAIFRGELSQERWSNYLKLKIEARIVDDKTGYLREKQQIHRWYEKQNRKNNKSKR
jgi:ribosome biogenesis GTPase